MSEIKNRAHMGQLKDFTGLRFGNCMPTDIDAFMDFGDKLFIFVEAKYGFGSMSFGQRLALQRLTDACHYPPKRHAIAFICRHDSDTDIDLATAIVTNVRHNGEWSSPANGLTLRDAIGYAKDHYGP